MTIQIETLNPDVKNLLEELVKLNLIKIKDIEEPKIRFSKLLNKLRDKEKENISLEDISKEVDIVREKRSKGPQKSDG